MALAALVSLLIIAGARTSWSESRPGGDPLPPGRAVVEKIVDGDTIEIGLGGTTYRVRLLGVDTPESVHPTVPVQCFGAEASAALDELLPPGTEVDLQRDVESHDHFGRLLLYVYRGSDGLFVNQWLLDEGYAATASYEPNTTFRSQFAAAARTAERDGRGLWSRCDGPDQPLDPPS